MFVLLLFLLLLLFVCLPGHGGNGFLKFQDSEEISNVELADAFEQMWQKRRYKQQHERDRDRANSAALALLNITSYGWLIPG